MKNLIRRLSKFAVVGIMSTIPYLIVSYLLTERFHFWYPASATIAFFPCFIMSFIFYKNWVFDKSKLDKKYLRREFWICFFVQLFLLFVNIPSLYFLVEMIYLHYITAQILLALVLGLVNFFTTQFIFKRFSPVSP